MEKIEEELRGIVLKGDWEVSQEVIKDMVRYWDERGGSGSFPEFIKENFVVFWIARVSKN